MIFDTMDHLPLYRGLNANLDTLIDYVLAHRDELTAPGRREIDGSNCWVTSMVSELVPACDRYERHKQYLDLQIPLDGGEIIRVRPVDSLPWTETPNETEFVNGAPGTVLDMQPGTFAIFFPWDAHNCTESKDGTASIRKLVGKALYNK